MENYNPVDDKDRKMADLILENHFLILVLERFGVSFGLQDMTIEEVCDNNNINISIFFTIVNLHLNLKAPPGLIVNDNDIGTIVKYLERSHQYYSSEVIPHISQQIRSLCSTNKDLSFKLIERFFDEYKDEVSKHLRYEESVVYPYALSLLEIKNQRQGFAISDYKNNHEDIETKLDDLKNLLIKYLPEKGDQKYRRNLLFQLFRFEKDLRIHTIIEENILIPQIEKAESKLMS